MPTVITTNPRPARIRASLAMLATAAAVLTGCGGADPAAYAPLHDLAAELAVAEVHGEAGRLAVGRPEADPWLLSGFSGAETSGFRWSLGSGAGAEVRFFLAAPRRLDLSFRAFPYDWPGAPPQQVTLRVNGRPVGQVTLMPGPREYAVEVPADALAAGENRLVLSPSRAAAPAEVSGGDNPDPRPLAVAWEWIRFGAGEAPPPPRSAAGDLYLPFGTRVDYYLRLPPGAALLLDGLTPRSAADGRLEVTVEEDGGEARTLARWTAGAAPRVLPLAAGKASRDSPLVRLSLTAVPDGEPAPSSGLLLARPAVGVPRSAAGGEAEVAATTTAPVPARRPNLIVYLVDALRADRLGVYGYRRPTSPRLDAFAAGAGAIVFDDAVAQSPWTRPSVTTLFTGLTPPAHGVVGRVDSLSPDALTLAEVLHGAGYRTAAAVTNPNVAGRFGLRQGFETYDLLSRTRSEHVTEWAEAWLDGRAEEGDQRPFFLYLHTVDPHAPYAPETVWRQRFAAEVPDGFVGSLWLLKRLKTGEEASTVERVRRLSALYDAEVAANDASFGDLLGALTAHGLEDDTVVVFVSDHGEELHDHGGWEHAETLYHELLHVPLVIRLAASDRRGPSRRIAAPVQHADLMPTLLASLGLPVPAGLEGRDLTSWWTGDAAAPAEGAAGDGDAADEVPLFSHVDRLGVTGAAVTTANWRCIDMLSRRGAAGPSRELYQRRDDPTEHTDLAERHPVRTGWCRQLLRVHAATAAGRALTPGAEEVDPELAERLRALGYL